jgi:protein TonB
VLDATTEFVSEMPSIDLAALSARVVYPRIASEHGVEGLVRVRALIGIDGAPERVEVAETTNRIFDEAALEAVRAARFTPAKQNELVVRVWVEIPIRFELQ